MGRASWALGLAFGLAMGLGGGEARAQDAPRAPKKPRAPATAKPAPAQPELVVPSSPAGVVDAVAQEILRRAQANPFPGTDPTTGVDPTTGATAPATPATVDLTDPLAALKLILGPHGRWIEHLHLGTMWIPNAEEGFAPYRTRGRWAVDQDGAWTWLSGYEWGAIPFHYGNWMWLPDERGWAWIPGESFAPAHVVWRLGEIDPQAARASAVARAPFVGWAPIPPSSRWIDGKAEPVPAGKRTLAFVYTRANDVFAADVASRIVRDPALGLAVHQGSRIFAQSLDRCSTARAAEPPERECDAAARSRARAEPWTVASPSFADARIALGAVPIGRVKSQARSLRDAISTESGSRSRH